MSRRRFLEAEFDRNRFSSQEIFEQILKPHMHPEFHVLDYGCGPGFLAKAVSSFVKKVYAVDISRGVLECAKILDAATNIEYSDAGGLQRTVADNSLDAICSIAVVQYATGDILGQILKNCHQKLKVGGKILFHVKLPDPQWRTGNDWLKDQTLMGKVRYR
jgi:predicted TPR repeat methyltransferase